jgi:uncharacterized YceG family protein
MTSSGGWGSEGQYGPGGAGHDPYADDEYADWQGRADEGDGGGGYAGSGSHDGYDEYDEAGEYYDGPDQYSAPGQLPGESFYPAQRQLPAEPYSMPGRPGDPYDFQDFGGTGQGRHAEGGGYGAADDDWRGPAGGAQTDHGSQYGYGDGSDVRGRHSAPSYDADSYGADPYPYGGDTPRHGGSNTGSFGRDSGSFGQPDARSYGLPDAGAYGRPDSGPYGVPDDPYGQPDSRPYGQPDSRPYGQPDSRPYGQADTGSWPPDSGSWRQSTALPTGSDGYAGWQDDPDGAKDWGSDADDDDWDDDARGGLLSSRFGRGGGGNDGRRDRRARRWPRRVVVSAIVVVAVLVLGIGGNYAYQHVHGWLSNRYGDYSGSGYGSVKVVAPQGSNLTALGPTLLKDGVIKALRPFDNAARTAPNATSFQPGTYTLRLHMNSTIAVQWLLSGKHRTVNTFTVFPGERASLVATKLAKQTGLPLNQFTALIEHPTAALGLPKWGEKTAEGFLYPDTYTLGPHEPALQILQTMVTNFKTKVGPLNLPALAASKSVTPLQALTAASLIQDEGGRLSDFPKISRVIWNRIQKGMRLQFDSTVFYAMGKYGTYVKTNAEKNFPSPYNTYLHTGLPPGPISSPSVAAIEASLHAPAHSCLLYFITDIHTKPPTTHFTCSYSQFQHWQLQFEG